MIYEVAHQMSLAPIVAMLLFGRDLPRAFWLVALGLAMSWVGDSVNSLTGGSWGAFAWYRPLQFMFVVAAFTEGVILAAWMLALGVVAVVSFGLTWPGPDLLLVLTGSFAVLMLMHGPLWVPLAIYFGLGTVAYFWLIASIRGDIEPAWYTYQGCRAAGIASFIGVALLKGDHQWSTLRQRFCRGCSWLRPSLGRRSRP